MNIWLDNVNQTSAEHWERSKRRPLQAATTSLLILTVFLLKEKQSCQHLLKHTNTREREFNSQKHMKCKTEKKETITEGEEKVKERDSRRVRSFLGNSFRITKRVELGFHTQPSLTGERGRVVKEGNPRWKGGGIRELHCFFFSYRGIWTITHKRMKIYGSKMNTKKHFRMVLPVDAWMAPNAESRGRAC